MSMFNDISCNGKGNEKVCLAHVRVVSLYAPKFGTRQWSFIGPSSEKSGTPSERTVHKESETISRRRYCGIRRKRMSDFPCYDLHGKLSIHFAATQETIETFFA